MPSVKKTTVRKPANRVSKPRKPNNGQSIVDSITSVGDLPTSGVKMLITGPTKTGKTTLACSAPKPLLLIRPESVEDGARSVRTVKGVDASPFLTSCDQLKELVEYQAKTGKYKTLVLDGVQFFQDLVLKKILSLDKAPVQLQWGTATQQNWGQVGLELKQYLRDLFALADEQNGGTNIIVTGGERVLNNDPDASSLLEPKIVVAVSPSAAGWLNFVADYIVCTFLRRSVEKVESTIAGKKITTEKPGDSMEYCLRIGPHEAYTTGFRVPKGSNLPDVMIDPTFKKLQDLM
tara:strand:- start:1076 stop:1948 length:873 start_codon:yes stop_codon:yes gene_type:complete